MITPQFPYPGNQIILSSDRVVLHSKKDGVYIFGKATVGISSPSTINLDSNEAVKIDSPIIELGHMAKDEGEQVVLGNRLTEVLQSLAGSVQVIANGIATGNSQTAATNALTQMTILQQIQAKLDSGYFLSENTYTA